MDESAKVGVKTKIADTAEVGVEYTTDCEPPAIGSDVTIRSGTVVYADTIIEDEVSTGHHAVIREYTTVGAGALVGTHVVIDGHVEVGAGSSLQTGVYVPQQTTIGKSVFLGPNATLLNDMYPVREEYELIGPVLEDNVSIGANATVLPDVTIGARSFVAAGAVVTDDVPPDTLAVGAPAVHEPLPENLRSENDL